MAPEIEAEIILPHAYVKKRYAPPTAAVRAFAMGHIDLAILWKNRVIRNEGARDGDGLLLSDVGLP